MGKDEQEIRVDAKTYGIDPNRIEMLDIKMLEQIVSIADTPEEMDEMTKELENGDLDKLKKVYDVLQDYNQHEISFYIMSLITGSIDKNVGDGMNKSRCFRLFEMGQKEKDEKYLALGKHIALNKLKDDVLSNLGGGSLGGPLGGLLMGKLLGDLLGKKRNEDEEDEYGGL